MKIVNNLKVTAAGAVLVLVAAACGAGEVSGGGSADSAISSRGKISIAMETKGLCVRGTERDCAGFPPGGYFQVVKGEFADSGKNASWPNGVSMKFEGSFGTYYPKDLAESTAQRDCPAAGLTCWIGIVGYRSGDERHYPNPPTFECSNFLAGATVNSQTVGNTATPNTDSRVAVAMGEEVSRLQERVRDNSKESEFRNTATGVALVFIVDTNRNGEIDSREGSDGPKDVIMLTSLCGPYSNEPGLSNVADVYSYATCASTGGTSLIGGFHWNLYEYFYDLISQCPAALRSGNLKIKMLSPTTTTTTTTTTTLPPN
ncbi:hypothetical protein IMCC26256_111081 [Actinobacteria bacterium IMCC26256]|nr:hypothetical protein IMCC26256_111081 [Actinobacteria bacterium IMCC26256]